MSLLQADCPRCGRLLLDVGDLACAAHPSRGEALCQFACPICDLTVTQDLPRHDAAMLRAMGAGEINGCVPFELVEHHAGPPLSLNDLLDFHEALRQLGGLSAHPVI